VTGQTILILSSDGPQAKFMVDCLSEAGYETKVSDQNEIVLPNILNKTPSLVILDWGFLNSKGLQIIRTIRGGEKNGHLPMLVMGTEMREEDVLASLEAGADICLTERLHPRVFVARVHSLLRRNHPLAH